MQCAGSYGRHAGYIAVNVSISGGAEAVVLPEKPFDMDTDVIKPIIEGRNRGKKHYLVIVAEGEKAKPSRSRKRLRKRRY